ncbi:ABC transporter permease [Cardiobacteriaceae bacterium TAE3-ERU3]|nr:ABC transporter permease [Cardiobacteriaceae bacterium TAE3-ERU3]
MSGWFQTFQRSARLEWRYLVRSRWDQAVLVWLPLISIFMLWWIFAAAQPENIPIAVVDQDRSTESRTLIRMLDASRGIAVTMAPLSTLEAKNAIQAGTVYAVVTIPNDFSRNIKSSRSTPVNLMVNAQYGTHSGIIQRDVRTAVGTFSAGVEQKVRLALGEPPEKIMANIRPLVVDAPFGFNITTNYQSFIAATLIPALLHVLATIAGAYSMGRELRDKTLRTRYRGSLKREFGTRRSYIGMISFMHGKMFWTFFCHTLWGAIFLSLITYYHAINPSSWWMCFIAYICLISISLWLGVFLTAVPISLRMGLSATAIITAPSYAFSGMTFPLHLMPDGAQIIANILPLTHYLHVQVMLVDMKVSWQMVLPIVTGMAVANIILLLVANGFAYRALLNPQRWGGR